MLLAVIMAGGAGTRLGKGAKALCPLDGKPLLQHVIARIAPQVERLVIAGGDLASELAGFGPKTVPDRDTSLQWPGSFRGLATALALAAEGYEGAQAVLTVPTDTPYLPRGLARALKPRDAGVAIARDHERTHPVIGYWTREAAKRGLDVLARYDGQSVESFARSQGAIVVVVPLLADESFLNVNTPEDLAAAQAFLHTPR